MAETNANTNTEKKTEANNEGGMNVSTSIPKSIVMSSSASYEKSMLIDIFDIGYTQSNLMAIYTTLSDTVSKAYDALTADDLKSKIEAAVKPFAEDPWGVADKLVQNIKEKVNEVSKIEVNATDLLEQLNKQIDELIKPELINAKQVATIQVPWPNHVRDALRHAYKTDELNVIEKMVNAGASASGNVGSAVIQKDIQVAARKNFVFNPNNLVVYQGTELRQYNFDIILMPQNIGEIKNIKDGILMLKKYSSADNITLHNNDVFLTMKGIFRFRFNDVIDGLMDINWEDMFYLTQIQIRYTGTDGDLHRFHDGSPKQMVLSLTFRERLPQYFNENDKKRLEKYKPSTSENQNNESNTSDKNDVTQKTTSSEDYNKINDKANPTVVSPQSEAYDPEARRQRVIQRAEEEDIKYESTPIYGN